MQKWILKACLDTACAYIRLGNLDEAELLYDQGLLQAEAMGGQNNLIVVRVLLHMIDLFQMQRRYEECSALWTRIYRIAVIVLKT